MLNIAEGLRALTDQVGALKDEVDLIKRFGDRGGGDALTARDTPPGLGISDAGRSWAPNTPFPDLSASERAKATALEADFLKFVAALLAKGEVADAKLRRILACRVQFYAVAQAGYGFDQARTVFGVAAGAAELAPEVVRALQFSGVTARSGRQKGWKGTGTGKERKGACYICGKEGHWAPDCPEKSARQQAAEKDV